MAATTPALRHYRSARGTTLLHAGTIAETAAAVPNAIENPSS